LLGVAGWLGGTLAYRNQFGVDHRYANAGKWMVEQQRAGEKASALSAEGLQRDQMKLVVTDKNRIVVGRTEAGPVAFQDRCTHRGASLADGVMICGTVQCPWHGSQFDCRTGAVKAGPAKEAIKVYTAGDR
jgi:nitrite reductase/ring-hydroxylating ferredoxin subunit